MLENRNDISEPRTIVFPADQYQASIINGELIVTIFPRRQQTALEKFWLEDAPFSYETFLAKMRGKNYISDISLMPLRTNHPIRGKATLVYEVKACYEVLFAIGCLPEMTLDQIKDAFNHLGANIRNARRLSLNSTDQRKKLREFSQLYDRELG